MFNKPTIYSGNAETITGNGVSFDREKYTSSAMNIANHPAYIDGYSQGIKDVIDHCKKLNIPTEKKIILTCDSPFVVELVKEKESLQAEISRLQSALEAEIKPLKDELEKYNQFIAAIPWFDESVLIKDLEEIAKRCGVEV